MTEQCCAWYFVPDHFRGGKVTTVVRDLDTPYHEDHARDNVLNAGCHRCARFIGNDSDADWQAHRARLGYTS